MILLPEEDEEFLNSNGHHWKPLDEMGAKHGLLIKCFPIPDGYRPATTDLMLLIPADYPAAGIDMFYFDPGIARNDRRDIGALEIETHFNRNWQRWSRHYDWRAGVDNVATHITYVKNQLESELR